MSGLCAYSDIFGRPGEGAHRPRLFGMAAVDLVGTAAVAGVVGVAAVGRSAARRDQAMAALAVFVILVAVSIPIHRAFCVDTTLTRWWYGGATPAGDATAQPSPAPPLQ